MEKAINKTMKQGTIREIYENHEPNKIALKGKIERLVRYFGKHRIPIYKHNLYPYCGEWKSEEGGGFLNKTRATIKSLTDIGETASANYLVNSFAIPTDRQRKALTFTETLEQSFRLLGEYAAAWRENNRERFELVRFQIIALMQCEVV